MVLSNKKLKQKLRSLVAESLAAAEAGDPPGDAAAGGGGGGEELQNLKELLDSKSQQPSFSNKVKKRKKAAISDDSKPTDGAEASGKENGDENEEARKKRKTEDDNEGKTKTKKSKKKKDGKKKKKTWREIKEERKKKKQERAKRDAEKNEIVNGVSNETGVVAEPIDAELREQNAKKVYVGGIPYYSTEDDIRSFFESCGTITEVDCMTFPESGKFRGIAILTFKTEAAAKRALALDGSDMGGFYLKIQPYKGSRTYKSDFAPEIVEGYNRAYVGNLSWDITEDDLQRLFSNCNISSIRFGMDKDTGDFKGFAHVDFSDSTSLKNALKFDQEVVCGRPVRIRCAVPKKSGSSSSSTNPAVKKVEDGTGTGNSKKQKRRTCYECGVPGHLSSACPKRATQAVGFGGNSC